MYRKTLSGWIKHWDFMMLDTICLLASFWITFFIRHNRWSFFEVGTYRFMIVPLLLANLLIELFTEQFKDVMHRGFYVEFTKVIQQVILVSCASTVYLFCMKHGDEYSRIVLGLTAVLYAISAYIVRLVWKQRICKRRKEVSQKQIVLMAEEKEIEKLIKMMEGSNFGSYYIKGICILDKDLEGEYIEKCPVVCNLRNVKKFIQHEWIDELLIVDDNKKYVTDDDVINLVSMGVAVHRKLSYEFEDGGAKISLEKVAGVMCITSSLNVMTVSQRMKKRMLDIFGALVGCFITLLIVLFIGPIIYIKSPGPIFFVQERIGRNGRHFKIYKLRSMYMDAEARKAELMAKNELDSDFMFKMDDDPRIIGGKNGIGGIIRRYSLDEFPQFFNVLKGDMSLVGTRPPTLDEWELYEEHHRARMATVPGITGMWQTNGRSDITNFEEVVRLDTEYIENWNIGLDIKIILKTILQIVKSEGAK